MSEIFEQASREKVRFDYRGVWTVEDLWDMTVEQLDTIYKGLAALVRQANEDSLLTTKTAANEILALKVKIVKRVVEVKLTEKEERKLATERRARKARLLEIMQQKQDAELLGKDTAELQKLIDELG